MRVSTIGRKPYRGFGRNRQCAELTHLWARTTFHHFVAVSNTAAVTFEAGCLHLSETGDRSATIAAVRQDV